jgi:BASS family bile acid:Na+ symporter
VHPIDQVELRFDAGSLGLLNVILGLVMFGVALDLKLDDFRRAIRTPKGPLVGVVAQFVVLPAATFLLTLVLAVPPSVALGMILVASCPGGNISNFVTHLSRGDTALSVTMTAISTALAVVMTPLNLTFWGGLNPATASVLREVHIDALEMLGTVAVLLGVPLVAGMVVAAKLPKLAGWLRRPFKVLSLVFFAAFIVVAFRKNFDHFLVSIGLIFLPVLLHNALALSSGYGAARLAGLAPAQRRAVAVEVGIQNSGLGLILIFNFFDGLGGMAVIAAFWGIWHIVAGLSLATVWSRRPIPTPEGEAASG